MVGEKNHSDWDGGENNEPPRFPKCTSPIHVSRITIPRQEFDRVNLIPSRGVEVSAMDKLDQIITTLARVEAKLDHHSDTIRELTDDIQPLDRSTASLADVVDKVNELVDLVNELIRRGI